MASLYAIYHGPLGLKRIAERILSLTKILGEFIKKQGHSLYSDIYFDTLTIKLKDNNSSQLLEKALSKGYNLRPIDAQTIGITLDESVTENDMKSLFEIFRTSLYDLETTASIAEELNISSESPAMLPEKFQRKTLFLQQDIFNSYHTETEMLRYIHHLQSKDISLACSMIPLGSCTMKLNATTEIKWCFETIPFPIWEQEKALIDNALTKDLRNFHVWNYRRYLISMIEKQNQTSYAKNELDYTLTVLEKDFSNFSAFHYRTTLIPRVMNELSYNNLERKEFFNKELFLTKSIIYTSPDNYSVWLYHNWLLNSISRINDSLLLSNDVTLKLNYITQEIRMIKDLMTLESDNRRMLTS
ncbi:hypothetical protein PCK2_000499 [Pneumocystis canis]|nr:hypothetical protein PCK2_000499 [Pneumocystis canis]